MLDGIAFLANGDYAKAAEKIIPIKAAQNPCAATATTIRA